MIVPPPVALFQSTSLLRGTTDQAGADASAPDISIHVPLARDDPSVAVGQLRAAISIHVPLARDDLDPLFHFFAPLISIHVPLARDDLP